MKRLVAAAVAAAALVTFTAPHASAAATTGNAIRNAVQPSNYRITVSPNTAMTSAVAIMPQQTSAANVLCFVPALTSHSSWGGVYWGGVKRCFNTYGNGTLTLYMGMP